MHSGNLQGMQQLALYCIELISMFTTFPHFGGRPMLGLKAMLCVTCDTLHLRLNYNTSHISDNVTGTIVFTDTWATLCHFGSV